MYVVLRHDDIGLDDDFKQVDRLLSGHAADAVDDNQGEMMDNKERAGIVRQRQKIKAKGEMERWGEVYVVCFAPHTTAHHLDDRTFPAHSVTATQKKSVGPLQDL